MNTLSYIVFGIILLLIGYGFGYFHATIEWEKIVNDYKMIVEDWKSIYFDLKNDLDSLRKYME